MDGDGVHTGSHSVGLLPMAAFPKLPQCTTEKEESVGGTLRQLACTPIWEVSISLWVTQVGAEAELGCSTCSKWQTGRVEVFSRR